jgi:pyridoxamine 5'-phosphate oxidase
MGDGPSGVAEHRVAYESRSLDLADLDPDPIVQWQRWYDEAAAAGEPEPNAMTLATVDTEGRPDARLVLVRGAGPEGFAFFTNLHSVKARQLAARPNAAIVFHWQTLHRSFRARGSVERVADVVADAYFASRPRASQVGAWASEQSEPLASRADLDARVADIEARYADTVVPRPPQWGGYRLVPSEMEVWQGRPNRLHDRFRYRPAGDGGWSITRLNP